MNVDLVVIGLLSALMAVGRGEEAYRPRFKWKSSKNMHGHLRAEKKCRRPGPTLESLSLSTPLRERLVEYQQLHRHALARTDIVADLHRYVAASEKITQRYLVYVAPSGAGLGNRLLGLLSAFLLALLSERVLLVDFNGYDIDELVCPNFINWSFPPSGKWSTIHGRNGKVSEGAARKLESLTLGHRDAGEITRRQALMSSPTGPRTRWENVQILKVSSSSYFVPLLFANPLWEAQLGRWFPDRNVAHRLAHLLLQPRDRIWRQVQQTLSQAATVHRTVGLQFRSFAGRFDEQMGAGAARCIDTLPIQHVFVASLHGGIGRYLYEHRLWNVTHRYADGTQIYGEQQAAQALHDIWLLSQCDELIVSRRSTLGYLAMALRGPKSVWMLERQGEGEGDTACQRIRSVEPCLHDPPHGQTRLDGGQGQGILMLSHRRDLFMHCEDTTGIKLSVRASHMD